MEPADITTYADADAMLDYLDQLNEQGDQCAVDTQELLQKILVRATSLIDVALGDITFAEYGTVASPRVVVSYGGPYLILPAHQAGSVTAVYFGAPTNPVSSTLYFETPKGNLCGPWSLGAYGVTAIWGYGPPPPAVAQVCLELAVNIYRSKDKGSFQEVLGASDGAALRFVGGFTKQQQQVLEAIKDKYREITV